MNDRERGTGLLELMVASTVVLVIVAGVLSLLTNAQFINVDLSDRSASQQSARMAMNWLQRDLSIAGVGLTPMTPVFPLVVPREDGGISIRSNQNTTTALITANTTSRSRIPIPSSLALADGDQVLIFDSTGTFDVSTVIAVANNGMSVTVQPSLSRDYRTTDGAAIARFEQIEYWLQGGVLMRQVDADTATPIAEDVLALEFRYFDDDRPPVEFTPTTSESQMRIRAVEARIHVQSTAERLQGGARPETDLRARISPRALSITRS